MIKQNEQFLGHWTAHTPKEALNKMINSSYATCYPINNQEPFVVTKGDKVENICL